MMKTSYFFLSLFLLFIASSSLHAAPCAVGTYSFTGDDGGDPANCTLCAPGTYAENTGFTSCTPCAAGTFQTAEGSRDCVYCEPGRFQTETGQTSCEACPVGTSQDQPGEDSCNTCEAGEFTSNAASRTCLACAEDTFSASDGASSCESCPTGTYADEGSSTCESLCGDNIKYTDETCDDGNLSLLDGCDASCNYETNNDLAISNPNVNFSDLTVGDRLTLSTPAEANIAALTSATTSCTCLWSVNPTTAGELSNETSCSGVFTLLVEGQADLSLVQTCTSQTTYHQTLIIAAATASASSSGGCSLSEHAPPASAFVCLTMGSVLMSLLTGRAYRKNQSHV